jgi:hypothetical protein
VLLQPRYRRLLTVGGLLDEAIQVFRQHWITFALFSLVALLPSWLLVMLSYAAGFSSGFTNPGAVLPSLGAAVGFLFLGLLAGLCGLLWSAASTAAAAMLLSGQPPTLRTVYGLAFERLPALIGCTLIFGIVFVVLTVASTLLFVVTLFGTLGTLIALVGLYFWWQKPGTRKPWLKWLIILTAPYGLAAYYFVRWSLYLPVLVLERKGPIGAMQRSSRLVVHQWFRAGAVLTLAALIVLVLVAIPVALVDAVMEIFGFQNSAFGGTLTGSMLSNTASTVCQVLFSSVATITYVLLYVDLRNRGEGTDLGERLSSLEAASA